MTKTPRPAHEDGQRAQAQPVEDRPDEALSGAMVTGRTREAEVMQQLALEVDAPNLRASGPLESSRRFSLERRFDATFVARLAIREKQVQQSYRPVISIHKWFARRPGSVFRSLLLSEYADQAIRDGYWESHTATGVVADPFMGGGTTVFEASRLGLGVVGCDINPMAYWLVRQAVEPIDLSRFMKAGEEAWRKMQEEIGRFYKTRCIDCEEIADVKYFLWVKMSPCPECGDEVSLFPGYRVAEAVRHPNEVYHCPSCDSLCEAPKGARIACPTCDRDLSKGNVSRGQAHCLRCGYHFRFAPHLTTPPTHRLFAIEYQCSHCYRSRKGRQFKSPDATDHELAREAAELLAKNEEALAIPADKVPAGDETSRLLRWGYHRYRDLFNDRQLFALGSLVRVIQQVDDNRIRHALSTVFSDFLRYQNLLCRYDTYALKCQDIFSVHGYPVGLIACENNLPGIPKVGSGSFIHFIQKYQKAKEYAQRPYETRTYAGKKSLVYVKGETIEALLVDVEPSESAYGAWLNCTPSQDLELRADSLAGVFTDPPYFDNVQYAELMDFCFVWLRTLLGDDVPVFVRETTRTEHELTGNGTLGRGIEHFTQGLSEVFSRMSFALIPGAPLVFTYHHNDPMAYVPLVVAILDAGLTCTSVLPAPAEMAASLHIAGTKSSILDSIFVCRDHTWVRENLDAAPILPDSIEDRVNDDIARMQEADYKCTQGDIACLRAGHVAGESVRRLAETWNPKSELSVRMQTVRTIMGMIS